jgi:hypothetical protein
MTNYLKPNKITTIIFTILIFPPFSLPYLQILLSLLNFLERIGLPVFDRNIVGFLPYPTTLGFILGALIFFYPSTSPQAL